jgi:hypothetical protein
MKQRELDDIDEPTLGIHYGSNISKSHAAEIPPDTDLNDHLKPLCGGVKLKAKWLDELPQWKRDEVTCGNCQRVLQSRD